MLKSIYFEKNFLKYFLGHLSHLIQKIFQKHVDFSLWGKEFLSLHEIPHSSYFTALCVLVSSAVGFWGFQTGGDGGRGGWLNVSLRTTSTAASILASFELTICRMAQLVTKTEVIHLHIVSGLLDENWHYII